MSPIDDVKRVVLDRLLDPQEGAPYALRTTLRAKLGMEPETNPPPAAETVPGTNTPPVKLSFQ